MILKGLNDKARSEEMLEAYESDMTFGSLAKKSLPLFISRILIVGFCIWLFIDNKESGALFLFAGGILLGALAQDLGWLLRMSNSWEYSKKITDWSKVKELAEEKSSHSEKGNDGEK